MMNRWLGGVFAASLLLMVACQGESSDAESQGDEDALGSDFANAENRVLPDGGVAAAGGRDGCRGMRRGRGGRGQGGHAHDGGVRADRDDDQDEDTDEAADEDRRPQGADRAHDGGTRARRDAERCSGGRRGGGHDHDGGPAQARDGGRAGGGGRDPGRDAGQANDAARTVTLPDGTTVRLDPVCPAFSGGGFDLAGCCLPENTCGLSTHLIDVTGVPKGCQSYATARQVDPSFPLADKACTFQK